MASRSRPRPARESANVPHQRPLTKAPIYQSHRPIQSGYLPILPGRLLVPPFSGTAPMTSLGSSPMQRADATKIGHWMVRELDKLRANQGSMSETHQLKAARAIYSVAFREAARQVTIHCAERGELLSKIFAVHSELLDGLIAERERWQVAEAAAWAAQQQAAQATQLRAHVARMLLSATQVMVQDDGLRAAAEAPAATSGGSSAGSAGAVVAAAAEGPQPGSSSEQARLLTRTLQLAAGLGRPKAEDLLFELMSDEADALPAIGAQAAPPNPACPLSRIATAVSLAPVPPHPSPSPGQERLAAVDALVGRLEPPRRATWLAEHAQQLPPAEQHALLVALLRHMGVSRWAALLAEVLVELPVQQLASVLAPALVLIPQPAWLELLQELPDASQLQVLEGLLQTQQAEKWVPVVRAQLKSLPPSVAARLREEVPTPLPPHPKAPLCMPPAPLAVAVDPRAWPHERSQVEAGVSHATDLWRDGAQASVGAERAANELARRLMEAEARAAAAEARLRQIELAAVGSDDSHAPSRDVDQNPASPVKALSGPVQASCYFVSTNHQSAVGHRHTPLDAYR